MICPGSREKAHDPEIVGFLAYLEILERDTRFELATYTLATCRSTN